MRRLTRLVYSVAAAGIIVLAGCSGSGGGMATPVIGNVVQQSSVGLREALPLLAAQGSSNSVKGFVNSAALATQPITIAVADNQHDVVNIYDPAGERVAQLAGFNAPFGLASDSKANLYVADYFNQRVQIYAAGLQTPPTTLSTPGFYPFGVDSFNNGQIVAVANFPAGVGHGNVEFFTNGKLTNTVRASKSTIAHIYNCAFDAFGNLYVQGANEYYDNVVGEIIGGAKGNRITLLTTSNVLPNPYDIAVTTGGLIAVSAGAGRGISKAIYTYNPPNGGSLGRPVFTTPLPDSNHPIAFAFSKDMSSLYLIDYADDGRNESFPVRQVAYPGGGKALLKIHLRGSPWGVAVIAAQSARSQK